jgi:hypothetical protein
MQTSEAISMGHTWALAWNVRHDALGLQCDAICAVAVEVPGFKKAEDLNRTIDRAACPLGKLCKSVHDDG